MFVGDRGRASLLFGAAVTLPISFVTVIVIAIVIYRFRYLDGMIGHVTVCLDFSGPAAHMVT